MDSVALCSVLAPSLQQTAGFRHQYYVILYLGWKHWISSIMTVNLIHYKTEFYLVKWPPYISQWDTRPGSSNAISYSLISYREQIIELCKCWQKVLPFLWQNFLHYLTSVEIYVQGFAEWSNTHAYGYVDLDLMWNLHVPCKNSWYMSVYNFCTCDSPRTA